MALDKLVDSTQLDTDLTSVANAIRTKGGTSASLLFPSEFISAIEAISGGGGSSITLDSDYITLSAAIVTVGTNSVANATQVIPYLLGLAGFSTSNYKLYCFGVVDNNGSFSLTNMAVCQDIVGSTINTTGSTPKFYRYRSGAVASAPMGASYDATLKSGDKYLIATLYWKGAPTV